MRGLPDLTNPVLPDVEDLHQLPRRPVDAADFEWPESGPSEPKNTAKVGPFKAKVVAAMTGAMTTSLLSM